MAKIAQLIEGNYNILDNIPVINQDLSASGFTPVANTYYRHTGATTDTFTQGVIYLYDTTYHKLGESGGGTTLNKYTYTVAKSTSGITKEQANILAKILNNAKSIAKTELRFLDTIVDYVDAAYLQGTYSTTYGVVNGHFISYANVNNQLRIVVGVVKLYTKNSNFQMSKLLSFSTDDNSRLAYPDVKVLGLEITYYNDTEIT